MKKVFVSGGSGYIAMYCIKILLEKGYDVVTSVRKESQIDLVKKSLHKFIDRLEVSSAIKKELKQISPYNYTGI